MPGVVVAQERGDLGNAHICILQVLLGALGAEALVVLVGRDSCHLGKEIAYGPSADIHIQAELLHRKL